MLPTNKTHQTKSFKSVIKGNWIEKIQEKQFTIGIGDFFIFFFILIATNLLIFKYFKAVNKKKAKNSPLKCIDNLNPNPLITLNYQNEIIHSNSKADFILETVRNDNEAKEKSPLNVLFSKKCIKKFIAKNKPVENIIQVNKDFYKLHLHQLKEFNVTQVFGYNISKEIKAKKRLNTIKRSIKKNLDEIANLKQNNINQFSGMFNILKLEKDLDEATGFLALILIDIDELSSINVAYQFEIGDKVIKEFLNTLNNISTPNSTLYHISADQFAFLIKKDRAEVISLVKKIKNAVPQNLLIIENEQIYITYSIGVAYGEDVPVLDRATAALIAAKKRGGALIVFFNEKLLEEVKNKSDVSWAKKTKKALEEDRIIPYYQGIRNNQTGLIDKFEVLARLKDEEGKIVSPGVFLLPASKAGLIREITQAIIKKSFAYFKGKECEFSINISSQDLEWGRLGYFLLDQANKNSIDPQRVTLEFLEEIKMVNTQRIVDKIENFKKIGFKIAIDDFGSINSSISKVLDLNPFYMKIDARLIKDLDSNQRSKHIVKTITDLAKQLNIKTIAEFVHSKSVQKEIEYYKIDYSQGFYYSEPTSDPFKNRIEKNKDKIEKKKRIKEKSF